MPSLNGFAKLSTSLLSLTTGLPESISVNGKSGTQLLGYFNGWTANLTLEARTSHSALSSSWLTPITVFSAQNETIDCDWVKSKVQTYEAVDDVFESSFMKGRLPSSTISQVVLQLLLTPKIKLFSYKEHPQMIRIYFVSQRSIWHRSDLRTRQHQTCIYSFLLRDCSQWSIPRIHLRLKHHIRANIPRLPR